MRNRYFSTQQEDEREKVRVIAIKRGTVADKTGTFHMDPDGKDPRARSRRVYPDIAKKLIDKGFARLAGDTAAEGASYADRGINAISAGRRQDIADMQPRDHADVTRYFGAGSLETRGSTAFDRDPRRDGQPIDTSLSNGETDRGDGEGEGDEEDLDETQNPASSTTDEMDDPTRGEGNSVGGDNPPIGDDDDSQDNDQSEGEQSGQTGEQSQGDASTGETVKPARQRRQPKTAA